MRERSQGLTLVIKKSACRWLFWLAKGGHRKEHSRASLDITQFARSGCERKLINPRTVAAQWGLFDPSNGSRSTKCGEIPALAFLNKLMELESFSFLGTDIIDGDLTPCLRLKFAGFLDKRHHSHRRAKFPPAGGTMS